jgi:hypothetical protein
MTEQYIVDGVVYNVAPHRLSEFLQQYPNAVKAGKDQGSQTPDVSAEPSTTTSVNLDSYLENTFSESQEQPKKPKTTTKYWGGIVPIQVPDEPGQPEKKSALLEMFDDFTDYFKGTALGQTSLGEATSLGLDIAKSHDETSKILFGGFDDLSQDDFQQYADAVELYQNAGELEDLKEWSDSYDKYKEDGNSTVMSGILATKEKGAMGLAQVMVQSMSQLANYQVLGAGVATGAGVGAATGGFGALPGFFMGSNMMAESLMTFTNLLQEELEEQGLEFNSENIQKVLSDEDTRYSIKSRALGRGMTIGTIEGLTSMVGIKGAGAVGRAVRGTGESLARRSASAAAATGVATVAESTGGALGETAGQIVEGREKLDTKEILLESIANLPKAPIDVAASTSLSALRKPKYSLDGGKTNINFNEFDKIVKAAKNEDLAKMNIKIDNDDNYANNVYERLSKSIIKTQIDDRVSDEADIEKLTDLEFQLQQLQGKKNKTRSGKEKIKEIQTEIDEIVQKYSGVDRRTKDVRGRKKVAEDVRKARRKILMDEITEGVRKSKAFKEEDIDIEEVTGEQAVERFIEQEENNLAYDIALLQEELAAAKDSKEKTKIRKKIKEVEAEQSALRENAKEAKNAHGFLLEDNSTGRMKIVINTDKAISDNGNINVAAHELLHAVLRNTFLTEKGYRAKEAKGVGIQTGQKLLNYLLENEEGGLLIDGGILARLQSYEAGTDIQGQEVLNLLSDAFVNTEYQTKAEGFLTGLGQRISEILMAYLPGRQLKFANGKQVFDFVATFKRSIEGDKVAQRIVDKARTKGIQITPEQDTDTEAATTPQSRAAQEVSPEAKQYLDVGLDNKSLVDIINSRGSTREQVFGGVEALIEKNWPVISNAIQFNPTGEISMSSIKEAISEQMLGIFPEVTLQDGKKVRRGDKKLLDTYNKKREVTTFLSSTLRPRAAEILARGRQIDAATRGVSLDEVTGLQDDSAQPLANESATYQKGKTKINILKDFVGVPENKIVSLVKPAEGDTFKQIIKKYAGKAGELIFGIPAKKIMEGGANLIPTLNVKEGMAVPSEASQIQAFYGKQQNLENFVRTLPLYNVTEMTADINRQGESIKVSRDTYGIAIGLKGLPLDYFYEDFIDPTGIMTSPKGRSKGLTSQTPVKKLKQKFRKPTKEVLDQLRKDLGMTPAGQKNEYTRNIGQMLKGVAKVYSINAALSGAQRNQEAKLKTAKPEEAKAIKQQTADITAAQSKVAFSFPANIENIANLRFEFGIDLSKIKGERKASNKLLKLYDAGKSLKVEKSTDIPIFIENLKNNVLPLLPKEAFFGPRGGTVFTSSNKNLGMSSKNPLWSEYKKAIDDLKNDDSVVYGDPIKGIDAKEIYTLRNQYKTLIGTPEKARKAFKDGRIKDFNEKVKEIHRQMWRRMADAIKNDKNSAAGIATYLGFVANDTGHWHKLGAEISGFSKKITGARYEYEHAMPATAAYIYLLDAALTDAQNKTNNFNTAYELVTDNYKLIALDKAMDDRLRNAKTPSGKSLQKVMPDNWSVITNSWFERYFNPIVAMQNGGIDPTSIEGFDGQTFDQIYNVSTDGGAVFSKPAGNKKAISKNINNVRAVNKYASKSRGMSTFDFDETLIIDGKNFITATKGDDVVRIPSDKWPIDGPRYADEGYSFDFSDFVRVRGGKEGPLLQKMKNQISKYGPDNVFVLTARMQEAADPIHQWLKERGINIPFKNITGLGDSRGDAKAQWFLDKYAEGYNDMYFVDDAMPNVKAVQHVFDQLDIKGKSVQARVQFSKGMSKELNKMIERKKGVGAEKVFSPVVAKKRGKNIGKYKFFVPPSADDFAGLLYAFYGKGKQGDADMAFMKKALLDPFARADAEMNQARMSILDDYKMLRKELPNVKKKLGKIIDKNTGFTFDNAVRVYLFDKAGYEVPGISKRDLAYLKNIVNTDQDLKTFANTLSDVSKRTEGWIEPSENWSAESIASDLENIVNKIGRKQYLAEFIENKNIIFSPENLNKIEATYGTNFRRALEDVLYRMENGTNRSAGRSYGQTWTNWVNGSVGAIMFFNARSAVLQTLSTVNFINFQDNNIFKAGKAFANQKQYWSDFSTLFNSDFLRARRAGLQINVNEAELANAVAGAQNKAKAALAYLLKKGFLPTQIADSFAIASGGSTFYRNRINTYVKQGMDQKAAEEKAFQDFQEIAQETQQSARPDRISQQQASPLGRLILAFANTPMQYNRLIKKAALDLANGRGDIRSNISRILYYGAIQNVIFSSLQSAIFALSFDDEEDDAVDQRAQRVLNGTIDTLLRGSGVTGAAISTIKNVIMRFIQESERESRADYGNVVVEAIQVSPPMGSKARKLYSALNAYKFNRGIMGEMDTFDYNNPIWDASGKVVSAATNVPLDRLFRKTDNIREAFNQENSAMQRAFLMLGWSTWDLQVGERVVVNKGKKNQYVKYLDLKRQAQQEAKDEVKEKKKEEKKSKQFRCVKITKSGFRCKNMTTNKSRKCYVHD